MLFAAPKTRLEDQRYIENFDCEEFDEYVLRERERERELDNSWHWKNGERRERRKEKSRKRKTTKIEKNSGSGSYFLRSQLTSPTDLKLLSITPPRSSHKEREVGEDQRGILEDSGREEFDKFPIREQERRERMRLVLVTHIGSASRRKLQRSTVLNGYWWLC